MISLDGAASLSSKKAMVDLQACSKTHGEQEALAMTTIVAEAVAVAQELATSAMKRAIWQESVPMATPVVNAGEVATATASSVISLDTWLVTVQMLTKDLLEDLWSASSASKKVTWLEIALTLMLMVAEVEVAVAGQEPAISAKKKAIWQKTVLLQMQEETLTRDLAVMTMVGTQEQTLVLAMQAGAIMRNQLPLKVETTIGEAVLLLKVETGMQEQALVEVGTTTNERENESRKVIT